MTRTRTSIKLLIILAIALFTICILGASEVKAFSESDILIKNELVDGLIEKSELYNNNESVYIAISTSKLYDLMNNINLLKQNIMEDNYVYDYFFVKLPSEVDNASMVYHTIAENSVNWNKEEHTENLEIVTIDNIKYVRCPFVIAQFINNEFYVAIYNRDFYKVDGTIEFKKGKDTISKLKWDIGINEESSTEGVQIRLESDIDEEYASGGQGDPGWQEEVYSRIAGNGNCYIALYANKYIADNVTVKPFGKLNYVGETTEDFYKDYFKYKYMAQITDKNILNNEKFIVEYLSQFTVHTAYWNFEGDLITINPLDYIPDTIELDIPEVEYEKAQELIKNKIKAIWNEEGIETTGIQLNVYGCNLILRKRSSI